MDELTACRTLRIAPGSTREEIKEAYAALSKEFHPEEFPEEFQKIHEAYVTLSRKRSGGHGISVEMEKTEKAESKCTEAEEAGKKEDGQYDFDEVLNKSKQREQERIGELLQEALEEFTQLIISKNKNNTELFHRFFLREEYQEILESQQFMSQVATLLSENPVKWPVCECMIEHYRLYYRVVEKKLIPVTPNREELYKVLYEKKKQKSNKTMKLLFLVAFMGMAAGRALEILPKTEMLLVSGGLLLICVFLFRTVYEKHSSAFSQGAVALLVLVWHLVGRSYYIMLLGETSGTAYSGTMALLSIVWMLVVGIRAWFDKGK